MIHEWGCVHNPAYGGANHKCECADLPFNNPIKTKVKEFVKTWWSVGVILIVWSVTMFFLLRVTR